MLRAASLHAACVRHDVDLCVAETDNDLNAASPDDYKHICVEGFRPSSLEMLRSLRNVPNNKAQVRRLHCKHKLAVS